MPYILHGCLFLAVPLLSLLHGVTLNLCPCNSNKLPLVRLMKDFAFTRQEGLSQFTVGVRGFTFHFSGAHESLQPEMSIDFS